jgi:hypothetical protein
MERMENLASGRDPARGSSTVEEPLVAPAAQSPELAALAAQLRADAAREVPPFGAESVKMACCIGPAATTPLLAEIRSRGAAALLALESLRKADPAAYDSLRVRDRVDIYVSALTQCRFYNAWGVPGYELTTTAHALIALGADAVAALAPLLGDIRPAPLSGSQDAATSAMYGNRLCDYAWVLIATIQRQAYAYSPDPADRDRAIARLRRQLEGGGV